MRRVHGAYAQGKSGELPRQDQPLLNPARLAYHRGMTTALASLGFSQPLFDAFLASRQEPDWLTAERKSAFETFLKMALPGGSPEEWRRTDIRALKLDKYGLPLEGTEPAGHTPAAGLLTQGVNLGGRTVAVNSRLVQDTVLPEVSAQGVVFGSLDKLAATHGDLIRKYLFHAAPSDADKFAALHAACWSGGTLLYVPRGVKVTQPLHIQSEVTGAGADLSHTLVILDEGAEATVLSETAGGADQGLHVGGIELFVGPGARLRYVNLQNWGLGTWHFAHQKALVAAGGQLQWTIGALGARLAKVNQHVGLTGKDADVQVNGVMFTEGKQHLAYHTLQHHEAPHGKSDLLYKGALQDHSRLVWRGMIKVDPGAQKTNGYQRNDNLMLSADARADSIPGLEIEADDVICTHGATAGRVEQEPLFYAQCRGLTPKEASRMIVTGFFQQVFDRITIESVRDALTEAIGRRVRQFT